MKLRTVEELEGPVSADVLYAIEVLESQYGARHSHDSGHLKTAPTWIFDLPRHGNAQVAIRMNKGSLSMYLRERTVDGRNLADFLPAGAIKESYPNAKQKNPANSILTSSLYLKPSAVNRLLRVQLERHSLSEVLSAYLEGADKGASAIPVEASEGTSPARSDKVDFSITSPLDDVASSSIRRRAVSEEEMLAQLDRNSETGRAGELIAMNYERERLAALHCPEPERYVRALYESDVAKGYDIESCWPGEERCIEVKSTTRLGSDLYLSENECRVLRNLGPKAWLYRVVVMPDGGRVEGDPLQDPVVHFERAGMTTAMWRVQDLWKKEAPEYPHQE